MLTIEGGWDWFHSEEVQDERLAAEETKARDEGRWSAWMRSDGDQQSAIIAAVRDVKAPPESVRFVVIHPLIADCLVVVAWDDRSVNVVQSSNDEGSEWILGNEIL